VNVPALSVAAAAEKLHLDIKVIEALEADRFAELGASVYVRGHLRRYADFVGEPGRGNGRQLHGARSTAADAGSHADSTGRTARGHSPHGDSRSSGSSCAAVLLLAIWWVLAGSHGSSEAAG
jgi:cytoskeletal protein RodZ